MGKDYKPSTGEVLFLVAVSLFIALNVFFRQLFINTSNSPFSLENVSTKENLLLTAAQLAFLFFAYLIALGIRKKMSSFKKEKQRHKDFKS
ncbi:hypothetical protein [Desulfuromonas acetoxidans]|uniref:hypothetical protein n=1 Tax=Desulfuromonas acetoxidans TaxID=891 RepID=UPI0029303292|nr:hypothetical protein [Desulfuromonas acetoxidans]